MRTDTIEYAIHLTDSILGAIEFVQEKYGVSYVQGIADDAIKLKRVLDHIQNSSSKETT